MIGINFTAISMLNASSNYNLTQNEYAVHKYLMYLVDIPFNSFIFFCELCIEQFIIDCSHANR